MGNSTAKKDQNAEFLQAVREMNRQKNRKPPTEVATHLDKKYRNSLLEELYKVQLPKMYKKTLAELIEETISKEDLTSTIALLTVLKSNQLTSSILKIKESQAETPQVSDNVVIKFDQKLLKRRKPKSEQAMSNFSSGHFEETQQGRVKYIATVISKEIDKPYHPFRYLSRKFGEVLRIDQIVQIPSQTQQQYETKQKYLRKIVNEFCKFLVNGCLGIYKKWIIVYTGVDERKYQKWMISIVINQMWGVNQFSLRNAIFKVLDLMKVPLKIEKTFIEKANAHLLPENFGIDPQLRIEGNYYKSIYDLSELTQSWKPTDLIKHLELIKNSICIDIDQYHKMAEKGQVYEINGDNIMGIVAYLLCKVASKIDQIYTVLMFLKLVYGEIIYYGLDVGSYMYSTITGAIQYLESKDFNSQKWEKEKEESLKDTGCESVILQK